MYSLMLAYLVDEIKVFDDGTICPACYKLYVQVLCTEGMGVSTEIAVVQSKLYQRFGDIV